MKPSMLVAAATAITLQVTTTSAQTPLMKPTNIGDPTERYSGIFGLGGYTCKQSDDRGRLIINFDGMPNLAIMNWLIVTDGGTKQISDLMMPQDLEREINNIPPCVLGTRHAAKPRKVTLGN